jgi:hypothetical protein
MEKETFVIGLISVKLLLHHLMQRLAEVSGTTPRALKLVLLSGVNLQLLKKSRMILALGIMEFFIRALITLVWAIGKKTYSTF